MLYGEHIHAQEEPADCRTCGAVASVEVIDANGRSCGCYCLRHGRAKLQELTRRLKDHHIETARQFGIPADIIAEVTFGLGVTMMFECGHDEDRIVEMVRSLVHNLSAPPSERGAS